MRSPRGPRDVAEIYGVECWRVSGRIQKHRIQLVIVRTGCDAEFPLITATLIGIGSGYALGLQQRVGNVESTIVVSIRRCHDVLSRSAIRRHIPDVAQYGAARLAVEIPGDIVFPESDLAWRVVSGLAICAALRPSVICTVLYVNVQIGSICPKHGKRCPCVIPASIGDG